MSKHRHRVDEWDAFAFEKRSRDFELHTIIERCHCGVVRLKRVQVTKEHIDGVAFETRKALSATRWKSPLAGGGHF